MNSSSQATQSKIPVWGQDDSSSVLNNTHDGVPQEASGERIHTCSGLILTNNIKNNRYHHMEANTLELYSTERVPHQQHQDRATDHGNGCGEFPSVASTVGPSTPICIFWETQLLDGPLCNLTREQTNSSYYTAAFTPYNSIQLMNIYMHHTRSMHTKCCICNLLLQ